MKVLNSLNVKTENLKQNCQKMILITKKCSKKKIFYIFKKGWGCSLLKEDSEKSEEIPIFKQDVLKSGRQLLSKILK